MAKLLIASPDRSDYATITAGSEAASMPATNLFRLQPSDVWRATDLANAYVVLDRNVCADGGPRLLALLYHNGSATGTLQVRAAATEAGLTSAPSFNQTVDLWADDNYADFTRRHSFLWLGDAQQDYRWWRIDISDSSNADGWFQAGRLYLCNPYTPSLDIRYSWSIGYLDPSQADVTVSGASFPAARALRRQLRFQMQAGGANAKTEAFGNLLAINRLRGSQRDVLVMIDRDDATRLMDLSIYGLLTDLQPVVNDFAAVYEQPYLLTEAEHP